MKRFLQVAVILIIGLCLTNATRASEPLQPIITRDIKVDGFWKAQFKRITEQWLPHCIHEMEQGGAGQELLNLVHTAKVLHGEDAGKYTGAPWSDAYVYNTVESICMAMEIDPDGDEDLARAQQQLRDKLEAWIPIILAAQMENGYIHSYHTVNGYPHFSNIGAHEFYVMGYFMEMGVAHYRMTDGEDTRLYDAARRCADHLCDTFGPEPRRTWKNGHAGIEYALCRLGRLVNEVDGPGEGDCYINLAKHFLDHQHEIEPNPYNQSERPAIEMDSAAGHAVRATYFYTAMADMALLKGDIDYQAAVDQIWDNAIHKKHYITGGVGASHNGEAFAGDFELPQDGYCESCAGCGMGFWADRMNRLHHDATYHDVEERVLYNNVLGALELSGENFFYQNPLQSNRSRYPWHGCPCCVGNIPRTLLGIKNLMYVTNTERNTLYVNHFVDSEVTVADLGGTNLTIDQATNYPWEGKITLTLHPEQPTGLTVKLRIPDRTESDLYTATPEVGEQFDIKLNGQPLKLPLEKGYVAMHRTWRDGDTIELVLPMDIQRVHCDERVAANRGRVALIRGPLVYNVESVDHEADISEMVLSKDASLSGVWQPDLLGGVMTIEGEATVPGLSWPLPVKFTAVPNYARLNRGGSTQVWLIEDPSKVVEVESQDPLLQKPKPVVRPELDKRTLDRVVVGEDKSEKEHKFEDSRSGAGVFKTRRWRHAHNGWFSYSVKVYPEGENVLLCTYWGSEIGNRRFEVLVDGKVIARQELDNNVPGKFFDVETKIPEELTQGKSSVTVRFQALPDAIAGGVFDVRTLKQD